MSELASGTRAEFEILYGVEVPSLLALEALETPPRAEIFVGQCEKLLKSIVFLFIEKERAGYLLPWLTFTI